MKNKKIFLNFHEFSNREYTKIILKQLGLEIVEEKSEASLVIADIIGEHNLIKYQGEEMKIIVYHSGVPERLAKDKIEYPRINFLPIPFKKKELVEAIKKVLIE